MMKKESLCIVRCVIHITHPHIPLVFVANSVPSFGPRYSINNNNNYSYYNYDNDSKTLVKQYCPSPVIDSHAG